MRTSNLRKILEKDTERTANSCEAPSETIGDSGCRDISKTTSTNGCQAHNVHKNLALSQRSMDRRIRQNLAKLGTCAESAVEA
jgi:hypothetical protein